jgi:hypothetical protein
VVGVGAAHVLNAFVFEGEGARRAACGAAPTATSLAQSGISGGSSIYWVRFNHCNTPDKASSTFQFDALRIVCGSLCEEYPVRFLVLRTILGLIPSTPR